ncbi:Spy/CpxP family protein refolding chaperone [Morganella psychrotolerans]|uniref:Periplasmic heavy metal sensor n=1 Tax=Morganella psychrotolerans TaxID=368603 RepID=A0A5M9QZF2_9GAMM|nr:Spy/CpxP family protein refolding chaperone [Morganella psychrotolerans]KAA8713232.1 periplasmic heavy metal sensor [Morganella psychrotolerans]OBU03654.1 hypothetical protein AYY16_14545 [Morganella psychrotolerans]
MGKIATITLASIFVMHTAPVFAQDTESDSRENAAQCHSQYKGITTSGGDGYTSMLTGIRLTEEQRMRLRDLMENYRDQLRNVRNLAEDDIALYELVKAIQFDETAVRSQLEKEMRKRLDYQVEMIRVHHQMYQLLNQEQKLQLDATFEPEGIHASSASPAVTSAQHIAQ